jgi:ELWxxDGT repeat protein
VAGASASPSDFTEFNGALYFGADDGVHGNELWKTDGTAPGTVMVKDINTAVAGASASPNAFTAFNGALYFSANDGVHGVELWKTDGTAAGTVMVKDINPTGDSGAFGFVVFAP